MNVAVWWIRRDMRLSDNGALASAAAEGRVVPLFVVDPAFANAGATRLRFMYDTLRTLDEATGGALVLRHGDPAEVVPAFAISVGARSVHVAADFAPYGRARDARVKEALSTANVRFVEGDTPYVVAPGTVRKDDGTPLKVFTPFFKRWSALGLSPIGDVSPDWYDAVSMCEGFPDVPDCGAVLPAAGERAALQRWESWSAVHLEGYKVDRDNPGIDGTSLMSAHLRFGSVHPRQLIGDLPPTVDAEHFRSEIAWRDFYADVLFHQPRTAWENLQKKMDAIVVDTDDAARARFAVFCTGNTGYPVVDAGIRQMLGTGWMHNRVRMIVASFLVKDLHLPWQWGARFFMRHLVDGDIASNNHGWQWTAGTGTDAAPYFRVFNPVSQGQKFDPSGAYVRTWIPELADVDDKHVHAPWTLGLLAPAGYAPPMVDHAVERETALARYKAVSGQ